jgi:hypothetical protein
MNDSIMPNGLRATGCLPRRDKCGSVFPVFESAVMQPIPRSQWPELIEANLSSRDLVRKIKGQTYGSCASHSATLAWECCQVQHLGPAAWIELSPLSVYVHVNGGRDRGSTISENLEHMQQVGALPVPSEKNIAALKAMDLDPSHVCGENEWKRSFPTGWKDTAATFRVDEVFDIESFDGLITALLCEFVVTYGRDMHAITGIDPWRSGSSYGITYANSWKPSWGDSGFGQDTESKVSRAISSYGAFAWRTIQVSDRLEQYAAHMAQQAR